ncbi:MAG: hypothetical protein FWD58_00060 [Firmicutes bacterium]|nr:hypothetical protein [Bacillota bacterium]
MEEEEVKQPELSMEEMEAMAIAEAEAEARAAEAAEFAEKAAKREAAQAAAAAERAAAAEASKVETTAALKALDEPAKKKKYVPAPLLSPAEIKAQIKPLSENGFVAFFQRLWRSYLAWWYGFSDKHPTAAKWMYMLVFFIVFSQGVTIWQFLVMFVLPYAFQGSWDVLFVWPAVELPWWEGDMTLYYAIFNEPVQFLSGVKGEPNLLAFIQEDVDQYLEEGYELAFGGVGNFIAFEIAVFTAQCINFPLQRNITFRSHGNPYIQAMWYFIGWVLISIGVNALWGICNPAVLYWQWPKVGIDLFKTFVTGGISMAVFFPIFLIIFPDYSKIEKKKLAKLKTLIAGGAPRELIAKAEADYKDVQIRAKYSNAEKFLSKSSSQLNGRAIAYFAAIKSLEEADAKVEHLQRTAFGTKKLKNAKDHLKVCKENVPKRRQAVSDLVADREQALLDFPAIKEEYDRHIAAKKGVAYVPPPEPVVEEAVEKVAKEAPVDDTVWEEVPYEEGVWTESKSDDESDGN